MKSQNISKKIFFSFATAALLSVVACSSDKEDSVLKETSKIEISDFSVSVADGDTTLNFYAAANWRATLNTTSWINIDPTTKGGSKGENKIILQWAANSGIKQREATLTITVDGENPVQVKVLQLPNQPVVLVDKNESVLKIDHKAANGRGEFRDTLTVTSNIKWTVKETADWFSYEVLGNVEPQEGVPTTIQMIVKGDTKKFNAAEMAGNIVIGNSTMHDYDQEVSVKAISELKVVEVDNEEMSVSKVMMAYAPEAGGKFIGRIRLVSNTSWSISQMPEWASASNLNNDDIYPNSLFTNRVVSFVVNDEDLDTEELRKTILIHDDKTGLKAPVELVFPGTGNDYFECKLAFTPDFKFSASRFQMPNYEPIPNAILEWDFDVISAQNFASVEDAPFNVHFVHLMNGYTPVMMPAKWLYIDMVQSFGRAALNVKKMVLSVQDRNTGMDFMNNLYEDRAAYMFMVPKNVNFEDLFDESEEIKEEYLNIARMIIQKGVTMPKPETNMPELFNFNAAGGRSETYEVSNFSMVSAYIDGEAVDPSSWVSVEFDNEEGTPYGIRVVTQPNTTGAERSVVMELRNYVEATDSDELVIAITVVQSAE